MKKTVSVWFLIIAMLMTAALSSGTVLAEEEKKTEEPKYKTIYYTEQSETVFQMQKTLKQLGYFEEGEIFSPGTLDEVTIYALQRFYADNQYGWAQDGGVAPEIQEFLIEGSPAPRPTPVPETPSPTPDNQPTPFPEVHSGERNDEVMSAVQIALFNKGYYEGIPNNYVLGYLDEPTEEAIKRFCEAMRFSYNSADGVTLPLFNSILAENAPVYATPSPTPFSIIPYATVSEEVRTIQNRLKELDYFRDIGEPPAGEYEEITQKAVRRFCEVHKITPNKNGMDVAFYERLMSEKALANPVDRREMHLKDQGDDVQEVQDRLFNLGYYKDRQRTGVYDEDMDAALAAFSKANRIEYDGETLTVALQDAILDEQALEYSEEAENTEKNLAEKLTGAVHFMGIDMPLYVLILVIVVILAALVFLIIRVFSSGKGDGGQDASASDSSKLSDSGKQLSLDIRYQGTSRHVTVNMDNPLRIGRNEQTLPLNPGDSDISRQHCQMFFRGDTLMLEDYSTNGTEVNQQSYHNGECAVHSGDTVKIGNHEITVRY